MANNNNLKTSIQGLVKTNGNREITGQIMQNALIAIINHFGFGSVFGGIAVPNTNPSNSDVNLIYFATQPGTYVNFGGYVHTGGLVMFSNASGSWVGSRDLDTKSVVGVEKISTSGYTDKYRMLFSDESYFDFEVTNGGDAKINNWVAGSYPKDSVVTVGGIIYRSNKSTNTEPTNSGGGTNVDWDRIGGGELDVNGGALSYKNGEKLMAALRSFTDDSVLTPGYSLNINETYVLPISGVSPMENTGLRKTNTTFGYDGDYRLFTYLNVPTLRSDNTKMLTIRVRGKAYLSSDDCNLLGVRSDGTVVPLLVGDGTGAVVDRTFNVEEFVRVSLSGDVEISSDKVSFLITYSNEDGSTADPEDAVKKYVDLSLQPVDDVKTVLKDFLEDKNLSKVVTTGYLRQTIGVNNQVLTNPDEWNGSYHNLTTDGFMFMDITFVPPMGGNGNDWKSIIGIKPNGDIDVILPINPLETPKKLVNMRVNVSSYEKMSINFDMSNDMKTVPDLKFSSAGITFEENGVRKYVDNSVDPVASVLSGFLYDRVDILKEVWTVAGPEINGVSPQVGQLTLQNTLGNWTEPGSTYHTYFNIPTTVNGVRAETVTFKGYEIGGFTYYANLIGIRENGSFDVLIAATRSDDFTPVFFDRQFSVKDYTHISVCFLTSSKTGSAEQSLSFQVKQAKNDITENAVKDFIGGGSDITSEEMIYVDKPSTMPRIYIEGQVPTDTSDARTPTNITLTYNYNNRNVFKVKGTMAIQGNWTVGENKKGYEFAFENINDDEVKIQIGDWIPCSEFHYKAYPNDSSFTRDITAMKLWHSLRKSRPFPDSYIADFKGPQGPDNTREDLLNQAIFYTDGFPTEMYLNGAFYGIYVWRLKKERDNYMIDRDNPNHVFLDNEDEINWTTFDYADWKVRSPRVSGYKDAQPINNPALMTKINRWWDWFKGLDNNTVDYAATKDQFIKEDSWVDAWIAQQVTGHWDYQVNNMLLLSWDGLRLSICFYDADQTWGWANHGNTSGGIWFRSGFWMNKLYPKMLPAIKDRYTWLRQNGVITMNEIHRLFMLSGGFISRDAYVKEYANWPPTQGGNGKHTMRSSLLWAKGRLDQLDSIWLMP